MRTVKFSLPFFVQEGKRLGFLAYIMLFQLGLYWGYKPQNAHSSETDRGSRPGGTLKSHVPIKREATIQP